MVSRSVLHISIAANTFEIIEDQTDQNPYIALEPVNKRKMLEQHKKLEDTVSNMLVFTVNPKPGIHLSDIVFIASAGLYLPRLGEPIVLLPWMKYSQRREELPYLKGIFDTLKIKTIQFPGRPDSPFEGQAEAKWFQGGTKIICGYGYRSTAKTITILHKLLTKIYSSYGVTPPEMLAVPIKTFDSYHLDLGLLEYDDTKCIVNKDAFSPNSIQKIKEFLGPSNVTVMKSTDKFFLNAIVDGNKLITHKLKEYGLKGRLEKITGKTIKEIDTSEFEKSGGSVRCMTFDLFI